MSTGEIDYPDDVSSKVSSKDSKQKAEEAEAEKIKAEEEAA